MAAAVNTSVAKAGNTMSANGIVVSVGLEKYIGRAHAALVATKPLIDAMGQLSRTAEKLSQTSENALKFRGNQTASAAAGLNQVTASSKGTIDSFSRVAGQSSLVITRMITIAGVMATVVKWQSVLASGGLRTANGIGLLSTVASLLTGRLRAVAGASGLFTNALKLLPFKLGAVGNSALAAGLTLGLLSGGIGPLAAGFGLITAGLRGIPGKIGQVVTASGSLLVSFGAISAAVTVLTASIGALVAIAATVGPGLAIGVKLAAEAEQAQIAFEVMLGSAEQAQNTLGQIRGVAVKTPFGEGELISASRALIAFGESGNSVVPTLQRIGDVSSGIGAPIGEIAEIYGKARVQQRLFAQDINQLTGRGIPIIQELAKQFGVTDGAVKKLVADGQVEFSHLEKAFISLTSQGGVFYGLTEKQSQSLAGQWSTFKDSVSASLRKVGQEFVKTGVLQNAMGSAGKIIASLEQPMLLLGRITAWSVSWIVSLADKFANIAEVTSDVINWFSGLSGIMKVAIPVAVALSAAILTIVAAQKAWAAAQIAVLALGGPAGWAKLAVGTAIAAAALYSISSLGEDSARSMQTATDRAAELQNKIGAIEPVEIVGSDQIRNLERVQEYLDKFKTKAVSMQEELAKLAKTFADAMNGTRLQGFNLDLGSSVHPAFQTQEERLRTGPKVHPSFATEEEKRAQLHKDSASSRAKNVWDANVSAIKQIIQLHGQQLVAQRAVIDGATGVYSETKNYSDQLALLQGRVTEAQLKYRDNLAAHVPPADALKLKNAMEQVEAQKKLNDLKRQAAQTKSEQDKSLADRAKSIIEENKSPYQKLQDQLKESASLVKSGHLSAGEALKNNKRLIGEYAVNASKSKDTTSTQAGTEEAMKAIIAAITVKDPQAKVEELLASIDAGTFLQNGTLKDLGNKFEAGWSKIKSAKF